MNRYAFIAAVHMVRSDNPCMDGLVLFAHGARDARWREPFERLAAKARAARPDMPVSLAFLELMQPDLSGAVEALVHQGCASIRVVPVFLGQGGHVREDLPKVVSDVRARHPGTVIELRQAVGEADLVLDQIVAVALAGL
jgi:sirohydrochlorin cobaltochelatase